MSEWPEVREQSGCARGVQSQAAWDPLPAVPRGGCVTLGKLLHLSVPQSPHLLIMDKDIHVDYITHKLLRTMLGTCSELIKC